MWPFNKNPDPQDEALLKEYNTVLKMMVKPILTDMGNGMFLRRVCGEVNHDDKNRMGIIISRTWNCYFAFHAITKNNHFSKSGPTLHKHAVGLHPFDPPIFGIFDIVTSSVGVVRRDGNSAPVTALGFEVVEMDTEYRPFIEFSEWKKIPKKRPLSPSPPHSTCGPETPRQEKVEDSPRQVAEAALDAALKGMDPIYRKVFLASQRTPTPTPQDLAREFRLPERAIVNIIGTARTRVQSHMHSS
jgi:hypothetical protein